MRAVNLLLLPLILCILVNTGMADIPDYFLANPVFATTEPVSVYTLPGGEGHSLANCFLFGGSEADASIQLTIEASSGEFIAGLPAEDLWLEPDGEADLVFCAGGNIADHPTDAEGRTSFSGPFSGGGWFPAVVGTASLVLHTPYNIPCLDWPDVPISINSPDLLVDHVVNLSDVVVFVGDYYGEYTYRSDFYWDGVINLSDIVLLSQALGAACR